MENKTVDFNEIAKKIFDALGGENGITYTRYQALMEALKPAKEIAKNNSHVIEEDEKAFHEAEANEVRKYLRVGDQVTYLLKSYKAVIGNIRVNKVTDKRFHVELTVGTKAVVNGKETKCGEIAGLTIGKKYVDFKAIQSINGKTVAQFLEDAKGTGAKIVGSTKEKHDAIRAKRAAEIDAQAMKNVAE